MIVLFAVLLAIPAGITLWDANTSQAQAPDFTLTHTGYIDGEFVGTEEFRLSDFRGDTVVLDFMAYNCGSCRFVTQRVMEPLWEEFGNETDFQILTIDVGDFSNFPGSSEENLVRWQTVEYPDSHWIHALDRDGMFLDYVDLGAIGLPSIFIVDGDGDIVWSHTGVPDKEEMATVIEASLAGEAESVNVLTVGIVGLAFVAGVSSFFAPCSVGLIPAYMGFLLQRQNAEGHASTIPAGLQTAAGIVSLYGVLAVVLWIFQDALGGIIPILGPVVGGLLVLLGLLMLIGFDWEGVAKRLGMGKVDGRRGFFAFGVGYGLAAFGCTGPIFLPILIAGFAQGTVMGFLAFIMYALAVASFVVFAAYLVGAGQQTRLRRLLSHTKTITRVSALLLIGAGAYLIWFDLTAFAALE